MTLKSGVDVTGPAPSPSGQPQPPAPAPPAFRAAFYKFRLESMHIDNTRSLNNDTDHAGFGLMVGGTAVGGGPQTKFLGDVNNGDHDIGLEFGVAISSANEVIKFNYTIVNTGGNPSAVAQTIINGLKGLIVGALTLGAFWTAVLAAIIPFLQQILGGACDGVVAADQFQFTGNYPGTDSAIGCGSNSEYTVTWSISGAGLIPVLQPTNLNT